VLQRRHHQIGEGAEYVRADRAFRVVGDQPAPVGLVLMNAEMIQPEPGELLLKLRGRVDRPQDLATRGFVRQRVAAIIQRLAGRVALAFGEGADALLLVRDFAQQRLTVTWLISRAWICSEMGAGSVAGERSCSCRNRRRPSAPKCATVAGLTPYVMRLSQARSSRDTSRGADAAAAHIHAPAATAQPAR